MTIADGNDWQQPAGGSTHSRRPASGVAPGPLGLGTAPLAGDEPDDEARARAAVQTAVQAGIDYFDTAPLYGAGAAERRLGAVLAELPRSSYRVSTKAGRRVVDETARLVEYDFSRDGIARSVEDSLTRLGLDHVDLVHLHDPDQHERQALDEAYPVLDGLRRQGVIGGIGIGMNSAAMPARFVRDTDVDAVLIAGRYTLLDRSAADDLLVAAAQRGVAVIAGGVFNSGILADPAARPTYGYRPAPARIVATAGRLAAVCTEHGVSLKAAAMRFPATHPAVTSVLIGCATAAEVSENVGLWRQPLPAGLWAALSDTVADALASPSGPVYRAVD
ncbi:D-threo-aldose 1-dehydrogenase [Kribbella orskensis]|uniref:D-threo-aldose 1-dehydrogenase n=1 Tax=Kribbella orskensis TaxID=2512216 RepID=A0ABY2BH68_9ACTN|nr:MULTISPECIES: aldo/keto reductase [Kribbella]TCN38299.1 D-threo-aldose 1-dehydrogenase [Kribbella sp. VKM Ac-2500]TCO20171.1 D-threo-aldose 1-dehydrogenase [Kribbella orskensis]